MATAPRSAHAQLVVVGSLNADWTFSLVRLPVPGETVAGRAAVMHAGGKGANQAVAAARLGAATTFAARVGSDAQAGALLAELVQPGLDLTLVQPVPGPSGQAVILVQDDGENAIVLAPGANHGWSGLDADLEGAIAGAALVLLQREIPERINTAVLAHAGRCGVTVLLDAGGSDAPLEESVLTQIALLSPNRSELERLSGLPCTTHAQVLSAARHLQRRGAGTVLAKLGAAGAMLIPPAEPVLEQPAFAVPVRDSTGAGDCFTAAYAVALIEGMPQAQRLRFACAAAALCVQRPGALASMPERPAVDAFLRAAQPAAPS